MQQNIKVDMLALSQKTELLKEKSEYINNRFYQLLNCIDELSLCWSGNAANAFNASIKADMAKLKKYIEAISKASEDYTFALAVYKRNNQKIEEIVKAIDVNE